MVIFFSQTKDNLRNTEKYIYIYTAKNQSNYVRE